jgi:CHRD domain
VVGLKGRRLFLALVLAAVVALALAGAASAAKLDVADRGGKPLSTTLTGDAEVPGPGDPDGSGTAKITVNPGQGEICYELRVEDITLRATGAHIHVGTADESGDVVVPLTAPDESGSSSGCADVSRELALAIIRNPENYYVNVHTSDFPSGAVRGQL